MFSANSVASQLLLDKKNLRQQMRQQRRQLSPIYRRQAAQKLLHSLRQSPAFQYSQHIAIYLTNDGEIDTSLLIKDLRARGKQLYLPVLHPLRRGQLSFIRWQPSSRMQRNRFGIAEPIFSGTQRLAAPFLQLICLPLVAFDAQGNRLGMGGGFYDRTLAFMHSRRQQPTLIGLAYELQKMPALPTESWDIPLSAIATEHQLYQLS